MGKHERQMPTEYSSSYTEEPERRFTAPGFDAPDTKVIDARELRELLPRPKAIVGEQVVARTVPHPNAMPRVTQADLDARYGQNPASQNLAERMRNMGPRVNTTAELTRNPDGSITRTDGGSSYTYRSKLDHLNNDK